MEEERFVSEVRAMERTLYRVARGYLRTWDECADAVQEALCKAWDKRKRVDESYFRPWLTRIVINECHNIGRRKKRLIPVAEPEREPAPEPALPELADALEALPEKLRQTAALRLEYPELSLVQLAEKCDPPVTKSCMNHRMRKLMEEAKEL